MTNQYGTIIEKETIPLQIIMLKWENTTHRVMGKYKILFYSVIMNKFNKQCLVFLSAYLTYIVHVHKVYDLTSFDLHAYFLHNH